MGNKYKAVLFDLDYTLVDATMGIVMCTSHALAQLNFLIDEKRIISSIGMSFSETFTYLTNSHCPNQSNDFQTHFLKKAKECLTENTRFYNDAFFVLKYLNACDLKLGIITSKFRAEVIELLKKYKLLNLFDIVICGDDVTNTKPHPEPILAALKLLEIERHESIYIGDNEIDSQACINAEVDFIGVTTGVFDFPALSKMPHKLIIRNLLELLSLDEFSTAASNLSLFSALRLDLQNIIDIHITGVGGYWPPEFGLARLFEEIAELYSCIYFHKGNLSEELADIFIISTCLANQYCSKLSINCSGIPSNEISDNLNNLVIITGEISRTISYYEGLKTPKKTDKIETIENLISKLHQIIFNICDLKKINIFQLVVKKILKANARDANRFSKNYDPSNALSVSTFKIIQNNIPCVYAKKSKVWGASDWNPESNVLANSLKIYPALKRFTKICSHENLDVFVIAAPDNYGQTIKSLSTFLKELLSSLAGADENNICMTEQIDSPHWQFTINETRLFITVFASCYPITNSRYNYKVESTLVLFQPEASFDSNQMPRGMNDYTRDKIRANFKKHGQDYTNNIVESNIEAARYIKPINLDDEVVTWWR